MPGAVGDHAPLVTVIYLCFAIVSASRNMTTVVMHADVMLRRRLGQSEFYLGCRPGRICSRVILGNFQIFEEGRQAAS